MKRGSNLELELDWGLPCPRIFENSQKNLRRARIKKNIRKWPAERPPQPLTVAALDESLWGLLFNRVFSSQGFLSL